MTKFTLYLLAMGMLSPAIRAADPSPPAAAAKQICFLETMDIETGQRTVVYQSTQHFEAPNWSRDGLFFVVNRGGSLYRIPVKGGEPQRIDTGFATKCNNDHGISPDGTLLAISDGTQPGGSHVYTVPIAGGAPRPVAHPAEGPCFWHGWSPDGRTLAYVSGTKGDYHIYTSPVTGGEPARLTNPPGKDDGPDYSADGRHIYYNSSRSGRMQIWSINANGANATQIVSDAHSDWFPHPSPDGKWIVFLSFVEDQKEAHPPNKDVMLELLPTSGGKPRTLARFNGGQGTMNVPSWSPDSRHFAFVSYSAPAKKE